MIRKCLVTGGAGFIGSHLVEKLLALGWSVTVLDNLSSSSSANLERMPHAQNEGKRLKLIVGDCADPDDVRPSIADNEVVFHFAANPEARLEHNSSQVCFRENVLATHVLLETIKGSDVKTVVFASTSTVYGEAATRPTPEDYSPLEPISIYGASKLASESLISGYCHMFDVKAIILRMANIVGSRSRHGLVYDFVQKLKADPRDLIILGDGKQTKSYLHVSDCVDAIVTTMLRASELVEVVNIGSEDQIEVDQIASIVSHEMRLKPTYRHKVTLDGGEGWMGDVKNMLLDVGKLKSVGWTPTHNSAEAIRLTARSLLTKIPDEAPSWQPLPRVSGDASAPLQAEE